MPVVPLVEAQLLVGAGLVPQHVPRDVIVAPPSDVTFAPKVAPDDVMLLLVGVVTVGATAQTLVVPEKIFDCVFPAAFLDTIL
jgi:hypothetical protein